MSKNRNDVRMTNEQATARQDWQRPEVRVISAGDSETVLNGNNTDIVFS